MKTETLLVILQFVFLAFGLLCLGMSVKQKNWLIPALFAGYAAWCGIYQTSMIVTLSSYAKSAQGYFPGLSSLLTSIVWDLLPLKLWWLQFSPSMYRGFDWFPTIRDTLVCSGGFVIAVFSIAKLLEKREKSSVAQSDLSIRETIRKVTQNYPTWFLYFLFSYLATGFVQAVSQLTLKQTSQTGAPLSSLVSLLLTIVYLVVFALFTTAMMHYAIESDKTQGRCKAKTHHCLFKTGSWGNIALWTLLWLVLLLVPGILFLATGTNRSNASISLLIPLYTVIGILYFFLAVRLSLTLFITMYEKLSLPKAMQRSWTESKKAWPQLVRIQLVYSGFLFLLFCPVLLIMLLTTSKLNLSQTGVLVTIIINAAAVMLLFPILQGTLLTYVAGITRTVLSAKPEKPAKKRR